VWECGGAGVRECEVKCGEILVSSEITTMKNPKL
jgi:hypothetical protein